jgi:hypothetical protein
VAQAQGHRLDVGGYCLSFVDAQPELIIEAIRSVVTQYR